MCHKKQKYLVLGASAPYPTLDHATPTASHAYPQLLEYMGLELTEEEIKLNMPEYIPGNNQVRFVLVHFTKRLQYSRDSTVVHAQNNYISFVPVYCAVYCISIKNNDIRKYLRLNVLQYGMQE